MIAVSARQKRKQRTKAYANVCGKKNALDQKRNDFKSCTFKTTWR